MGCSGYAKVLDLRRFKQRYDKEELIYRRENNDYSELPDDISGMRYKDIYELFFGKADFPKSELFAEHYVLVGDSFGNHSNKIALLIIDYGKCDIASIDIY